MGSRVMLIVVAALVAAVGLAALPQPYGAALVAGCAVFGFGIYVLRERSAIRGLFQVIQRTGRRSSDVALAIQAQLAKDRENDESRLHELTARLEEVAKELNGLHAAAANEILSQQRRLQTSVDHAGQVLGRTAERLDQLGQVLDPLLERLDQLGQVLDPMAGRLDRTAQVLARITAQLGEVSTASELRCLHSEALQALFVDFRQIEALSALHALFAVRAPIPPSRKWAASPDLLLYLTAVVLERRPRAVVELGSGLSTIWLAYAMEKSGHRGRIISLDHDATYAERTRSMLVAHGLADFADVRLAPIRELELNGEMWPWYDKSALTDLDQCDLLVVDGPPAATRERARYPALPVLASRLSPGALVVLDDCVRQDEKDILDQWRKDYPEWTVELIDHEKGTAVLSR